MLINNGWIKAGALIAALAVVLGGVDLDALVTTQTVNTIPASGRTDFGAFASSASGLRRSRIELAAFFQLAHALAIIAAGILMILRPGRLLKVCAWFFLLGIALFSGSIYLSVFTAIPWLQLVKLTGVVFLVIGWLLLVEGACPGWNKPDKDQLEQ